MRTILNDLFGPGTWGTGGNLVASALLTLPAIAWSHVRTSRQAKAAHRIAADLYQHHTGRAHPDAPGSESEAE